MSKRQRIVGVQSPIAELEDVLGRLAPHRKMPAHKVQVMVTLPVGMVVKLDRLCGKRGVSRSQVVRQMIEDEIHGGGGDR